MIARPVVFAVALAEMAMASGIGARIDAPEGNHPIKAFFGEDQGRYVVTIKKADRDEVQEIAEARGIFAPQIGITGGATLVLGTATPGRDRAIAKGP